MLRLIQFSFIILFFSCSNEVNEEQEEKPQPPKFYHVTDFTDSVFTSGIEGPAVDQYGNLYVVNFHHEGTIGKVDTNGNVSLFVKLPKGCTGNGIRFGEDFQTMYIADYTGHNVLQLHMDSLVFDTLLNGNELFNQPNDVAISDYGFIYASDPNWSDSTGNLIYISTNAEKYIVNFDMGTTNGIEVSPDNRYLYVNESFQRRIIRYNLGIDGAPVENEEFYVFKDHGLDGMRCDVEGNLYVTRYGKGTVLILTPEGDVLKEVKLKGKKPTNIAFGGPDGKTCYVTMQDRKLVETFRAEFAGRSFRGRVKL